MSFITEWLSELKFFDSGHSLAQVGMALFWFGSGIMSAFCLCAWSTIIRAARGAAGATSI